MGVQGVREMARLRGAPKYFFVYSPTVWNNILCFVKLPFKGRACLGSERRSAQGTFEFMLMLGAVLLLVASIVVLIALTSQGLGSSIDGQIDNVRDNIVIPGLVGTFMALGYSLK